MDGRYLPYLQWVQAQRDRMVGLVGEWAAINTFSGNLSGLAQLSELLRPLLQSLGAQIIEVPLPPRQVIDARGEPSSVPLAPLLHARRTRPGDGRKVRVLLGIHLDTVYPPEHPFQRVDRPDAATLRGPGVADAKGGLAAMLIALEALERSPWAPALQWEVILNPDEELGSPGSGEFLAQRAGEHDLGLLYEPAMADGALVSQRKGSGNFTAVVHGRSAHAGRDFEMGRNAIEAMARFVTAIAALNDPTAGLTVNVGQVEGGTAVNVVPDLAICRFNVRFSRPQHQELFARELERVVQQIRQTDGIGIELHGSFHCPPKLLDTPTAELLEHVRDCGQELGVPISWRPSGGVCDGNRLAAAGLPTLDSLGVRGGNIHSEGEYLLVDSLVERAQLSALLLMKLASGEIQWKRPAGASPATAPPMRKRSRRDAGDTGSPAAVKRQSLTGRRQQPLRGAADDRA